MSFPRHLHSETSRLTTSGIQMTKRGNDAVRERRYCRGNNTLSNPIKITAVRVLIQCIKSSRNATPTHPFPRLSFFRVQIPSYK